MSSSEFRLVFFGTSEFGAAILKYLLDSPYSVVAVVTRPDKQAGRSLKTAYSPVKKLCLDLCPNIPLYQPLKVSSEEFGSVLKRYEGDLYVVAAFGEIIKKNILSIPPCGLINVHPSLLPKYRGPSPLQAALFNGEQETGVCIIDVAEKMDAGVIYASKKFNIDENESFTTLQIKALTYTESILLEVIEAKKNKCATGVVQDESKVSYCHKITAESEKINWDHSLESIHNQIRALSEKPGAWSYIKIGDEVKRVKLFESELLKEGEFSLGKKQIIISKNGQHLKVNSLQLEGKKRVLAHEFLSGVKNSYSFI